MAIDLLKRIFRYLEANCDLRAAQWLREHAYRNFGVDVKPQRGW